MTDTKRVAKRIADLRTSLGMTQVEFAKAIPVPQSTVSKWELAKQKPKGEHMLAMAKLAGKEINELFGLGEGPQQFGRRVQVVGALAAGDWREALEWPHDDRYDVTAPLPPKYDSVPVQAFEVRGDSMNKMYPDGSIVYVAPIHSMPDSPRSGDIVAVMRRDDVGLIEATLKEYVIDGEGKKWLVPRSTSLEHQAPINYLAPRRGKIEEVMITGVVIAGLIFAR